MPKERIQSIDLVKIIAMLMVLMLHVNVIRGWCGYETIAVFFALPGIAIPLFFMVSGYLLADKSVEWKYRRKKIWGIVKFSFILCIVFDCLKYIQTGSFIMSFPFCFIQKNAFWMLWYLGSMIVVYLALPVLRKIIDSKYFSYCVIACIACSSFFFILNFWDFERNYVIQTFRLWYWFTYFLLGAFLRKKSFEKKIRLAYLPLIALFYCIFFINTNVDGCEYYFGSIPCIAYSVVLFVTISRMQIEKSNIVQKLSDIFLPVYVLHVFVIQLLLSLDVFQIIERNVGRFASFAIQYCVLSLVCIFISIALMRFPVIKKFFKI